MSKIHRFAGARLTVTWDEEKCVHAGECLRSNHRVFNSRRRPWVEPDAGAPDEVIGIINRCPSGALGYEWNETASGAHQAVVPEPPPEPAVNRVKILTNGPLSVSGRLELQAVDGAVIQGQRFSFCRCGGSSNKPFCDGSHKTCGFVDAGTVGLGKIKESQIVDGKLRVRVLANGPILLDGPYQIENALGETCLETGGGSLCRCGSSSNKPFCDGTHKTCGFADAGLFPIS